MQSVYLDNTLGFHQGNEHNLQIITQQIDNGKRSLSTISAMLAGMGIPKEKVLFAIKNYTKAGREAAALANGCEDPYNKKKEYNMQFNLSSLGEILGALKTTLFGMRESNVDKINYSVNNAHAIVESTLREVFDLKKTLLKIDENKSDIDRVAILKESLHPGVFKSKPEYHFINKVYQSLQPYSDVEVIKNFLAEAKEILKNNFYTNFLSNMIYEMLDLSEHAFYSEAIEDIQFLLGNEEKYIKENLSLMLNKHSWIPRIKEVLDFNSIETKRLTSKDNAIVERVYSPVQVNDNGSYIFILDKRFYQVNEDKTLQKVEDLSKLSNKFRSIASILNEYKIEKDKITLYKFDKSLEIVFEGNNININGIPKGLNDYEGINNALVGSTFFRLDEINNINSVLMLIENIDTIKQLDIVDRIIANNGNIVNIIKLSESNIYINRLNNDTLVNELYKAENSKQAQEIVNEFVNYDISNSIYEILEKEDKQKVIINNLIKEHEDRVKFLNEQLTKLANINLNLNDFKINEAIKMLTGELKKEEIEVQNLYTQKAQFN